MLPQLPDIYIHYEIRVTSLWEVPMITLATHQMHLVSVLQYCFQLGRAVSAEYSQRIYLLVEIWFRLHSCYKEKHGMFIRLYNYIQAYIYLFYMHTHVFIRIHIHVCIYICTYTHIHISTYAYTHTQVYIHIGWVGLFQQYFLQTTWACVRWL